MPKGFTEEERSRIEQRLVEVARGHFRRYGLRRTNVGELAAAAGIGKGSFYLFFPSKEALFLAVHRAEEPAIRAAFVAELEALRSTPLAMIKRYFTRQLEILRELPLVRVLSDPAELACLMRKLPPEELGAHMAEDQSFFVELLRGWEEEGLIGGADLEHVAAISRALVAMNLHRDLIGEEAFSEVVDLMVSGVATSLYAGGEACEVVDARLRSEVGPGARAKKQAKKRAKKQAKKQAKKREKREKREKRG